MDNVLEDFRQYLTSRPPGTRANVDRAASFSLARHPFVQVRAPELQLYCDGDCNAVMHCSGSCVTMGRVFGGRAAAPDSAIPLSQQPFTLPFDALLHYSCERCRRVVKSYSLRFWSVAGSSGNTQTEVEKLAECPPFSPPTPARVLSLVGPDRELFLKGRRAELANLGVGSFAYYRRVIEAQKNRFLDEIIRVARHLGTTDNVIELLEAAKAETQFSRAVDSVKSVIPPALLIKGHNPLTLLHGALSQGLHNESDEACLQAATDIRLVLVEFAGKLVEAMKEQRELDDALTRLVNRKTLSPERSK